MSSFYGNGGAPLDSPNFTGTPTTPDITELSPEDQIANKTYIDEAVENAKLKYVKDAIVENKIGGVILNDVENNQASGNMSHAEGQHTTASGVSSHAEGEGTTASGIDSHAEGANTIASGTGSHTEGYTTTASGDGSHSEGFSTIASGDFSHAEGRGTKATRYLHHVFGSYNIEDLQGSSTKQPGQYIEIVGNGTASDARSNARTLDWNGNEVLAGKLTVGAGPVNNMDVATKQYVDDVIAAIPAWEGGSF